MDNFPGIVLNIAVGGFISGTARTEIYKEQVGMVLSKTIACVQDYNNSGYGFSGSDVKVNLFSSPFLTDAFWTGFAKSRGMPFHIINSGHAHHDRNDLISNKPHTVMNINSAGNHSPGSGSVMPDWIADQTDLALLLWDGREDFNNREIWALIQACKRNNIPCIWIDVNTPENIYRVSDSYFDKYTDDHLKGYIATLFSRNTGAFDPPGKSRIPFWGLWDYLYNHFMKKHKARIQPMPYIVDKVLETGREMPSNTPPSDLNRQKIVGWFHYFDANAIEYSQKYRTSIYLRSIIPFFAAVFIALGFFAETILGFIFTVPGIRLSPWAILASIGFLVNGLIFFYIYRLAENPVIAGWHPRFIDNRFAAEALRLAAHFIPFGIPINIASSLNRFGSKISKNKHVSNELRRIIRSVEVTSTEFDKKLSDRLMKNLADMVNDQIIYHDYSIARYAAIISRLKKLTAVLFAIGLTVVILRGCLQFVLVYVDIGPGRNGIRLDSFIKSMINMFAQIFPAWASYFSLKLSLSNFEGLMNNSKEMKGYLTVMKDIIEGEMKREDTSFERVYLFSRDLTRLMLGEVADWYSQISTQKFTKL